MRDELEYTAAEARLRAAVNSVVEQLTAGGDAVVWRVDRWRNDAFAFSFNASIGPARPGAEWLAVLSADASYESNGLRLEADVGSFEGYVWQDGPARHIAPATQAELEQWSVDVADFFRSVAPLVRDHLRDAAPAGELTPAGGAA